MARALRDDLQFAFRDSAIDLKNADYQKSQPARLRPEKKVQSIPPSGRVSRSANVRAALDNNAATLRLSILVLVTSIPGVLGLLLVLLHVG